MRRFPRHPEHDAKRMRRAPKVVAALSASLFAFAGAHASPLLSIPQGFDAEGMFRATSLPLMDLTVGPSIAEAAGFARWDTGSAPRESTTTLNFPELRGASLLDALLQALQWESMLAEMYRGDRGMAEYWSTGSLTEGHAQYSVLTLGVDLLSRSTPKRLLSAPEPEAIAALGGISRALQFAAGGASGGSGGGGGGPGGRAGIQLPVFPPETDGVGPIVPPQEIPAPPQAPSNPEPAPTQPGTVAPAPIEIVVDLGDLWWTDPSFGANPQPAPPAVDPFDDSGSSGTSAGPAMAPTPTAALLAGAALLGLGSTRRRRFR